MSLTTRFVYYSENFNHDVETGTKRFFAWRLWRGSWSWTVQSSVQLYLDVALVANLTPLCLLSLLLINYLIWKLAALKDVLSPSSSYLGCLMMRLMIHWKLRLKGKVLYTCTAGRWQEVFHTNPQGNARSRNDFLRAIYQFRFGQLCLNLISKRKVSVLWIQVSAPK